MSDILVKKNLSARLTKLLEQVDAGFHGDPRDIVTQLRDTIFTCALLEEELKEVRELCAVKVIKLENYLKGK